jgi:hypothetical protein
LALIEAGDLDKARAMIASMADQRVLKPVVAKLNGDIALKTGDLVLAVQQYQASCRAASVEMLVPEPGTDETDAEAMAKLWRTHTMKAVQSAYRQRRATAAAS